MKASSLIKLSKPLRIEFYFSSCLISYPLTSSFSSSLSLFTKTHIHTYTHPLPILESPKAKFPNIKNKHLPPQSHITRFFLWVWNYCIIVFINITNTNYNATDSQTTSSNMTTLISLPWFLKAKLVVVSFEFPEQSDCNAGLVLFWGPAMYQDCSEPRRFRTGRNNTGPRPGQVVRVLAVGENTPGIPLRRWQVVWEQGVWRWAGERKKGFPLAWFFGLCSSYSIFYQWLW